MRRRWWGRGAVLALVVLALAVPLIAPQDPADPLGFDPAAANAPPSLSWTYLLGADARGRSVVALLLWGSRVSLAIGVGAALLAAALGVALGLLSCWRAAWLDPLVSRLMEVCQAAPPLLILLLLAARLGGTPVAVMLAVFALTGWVAPARLTRATVLAGWRAPYVDAARALGVSAPRLLAVYLLPAVVVPLAAWVAAGAATYIALEAGLDFLGLGLPAATTSWGSALSGAQDALAAGNWWWMTCGGAALALATLAFGALAREVAWSFDAARTGRLEAGDPRKLLPAHAEAMPALGELWTAWQPRTPATRGWRGARLAAAIGLALLLGGATVGVGAAHRAAPLPAANTLLRRGAIRPHAGSPRGVHRHGNLRGN